MHLVSIQFVFLFSAISIAIIRNLKADQPIDSTLGDAKQFNQTIGSEINVYDEQLYEEFKQFNNSSVAEKHCVNANIRLSGHKTLLHQAAIKGDTQTVHTLIDQYKVPVDARDTWGREPLYYAVLNNRVEIASILLQSHANPDSKDANSKPILHLVVYLDEIDALSMAKVLVQNKGNINITDKFNNTLLHIASMKGYYSIVSFLVEKGVDVNAENINNDTPLRLAKVLQPNRSDIASFLTQKNAQDSGDEVNFLKACEKGNLNLIRYLHEVRAVNVQVKDGNQNGLFKAIDGNGNLEVVKYLVNIGVSIREIDTDKHTLVNYAANLNKFDIVKYLIEQGADFKSVNTYKSFPLHFAAEHNNLEMIKYLLHFGLNSNINDKGFLGMTPLIRSIYWNIDFKVVKYLIKSGAQINITDIDGKTALTWAKDYNKLDIKQYLEQFSPDAKLQTQIDTNSLFFAAAQNNIKLVEQYLNKNISVNVMDEDDGQTPLYRAIYYNGQLDMVKYLHSKGADFKQFDVTKLENLVYLSILKHKVDVAKFLVESGADFQSAGISGKTPLHGAIEVENIEMIKYLLGKNAYYFKLLINTRNEKLITYLVFDYKNKRKQTMLHMAAYLGDDANVKFLIERGANINPADKLKNTPLHLAAQNGHLEIVKLLTKHICADTFAKKLAYIQVALDVAQYYDQHGVAEYLSQQMKNITYILSQFRMPIYSSNSISTSSNAMPTNLTTPTESIDLPSTLFLFDVLARKYTGQQFFNAQGQPVSVSEARTYSLTLVQQYEKMLNQLTNKQQTNPQNAQEVVIECDFFELYCTIERYLLSGLQYSQIGSLLYSHAHKALSTSNTHIDDSQLSQMIDRLIETNIQRGTNLIVKSQSNKPNLIDTNTKQQYVC